MRSNAPLACVNRELARNFSAWVTELYHLDMRPWDLARAIHLLLGNASLADQWLAGQQPFAAAVLPSEIGNAAAD
jgi:hypothetical protein